MINKRTSRIGIALVLILLFVFTTACSKSQSNTQSSDKTPIKIALVAITSGASAEMGQKAKKSAEMAVEEWNAKGGIQGHPIELLVRDDQYNPTVAVNIVNELINKDNVLGIVGPSGSSVVQATIPVTKAAGVAQIANVAMVNDITIPPIENVFRTALRSPLSTEMVADFVAKNYNKVGIIADNTAYGKPAVDEIVNYLKKIGKDSIIVGKESFAPADLDMTPQILRLKNAGAQVVIEWGLGSNAATIRKNMKDVGLNVTMLGSNSLVLQAYRDNAGALVEGSYTVYPKSFVGNVAPAAQKFADAFHAKYPDEKNIWANGKPTSSFVEYAQTYDAVNVLLAGINNAKALDRKEVIAALNQIKDFQGANSVITFTSQNHDSLTPDAISWMKMINDPNNFMAPVSTGEVK